MKKIFTLIMTLLLICSSSWAGTFTIRVNKDAACTMDLSNGLYLWWWSDVDGNEFVSTTLQDGWYTATITSTASTISCLGVNQDSWGNQQTADFDGITGDICLSLTGSSSYILSETTCSTPSIPSNGVVFDADVDQGNAGTDSNNAAEYVVTKEGVTMTVSSGVLGTYQEEMHYRIYKGQTLTLTSTVGNIVSVEFTCTANNDEKYGPGNFTVDGGSYEYSGVTGTWTGDATTITFTAATNQVRATQVVVSCESASGPISIPTASDLAQYEQDGYFVACINFQGEVCNDIVFVGSYNGWSITPEEMVHFTPLGGFDGWYVAVVPVVYDEYGAEANEGKPVQLASDGTFSWDYQTGDFYSWELISGSVDIMSGYSSESNLTNWSSAEPVILKSLYFKNNNSPCGDIVTYDYTINLKAPDCGGYEPAIIGDFNNWVEGVAMAPIGDGWYQAVVNSMPGRRVNFRASTSADWSNAIQIYDSEYGAWLNIADYYLTEETTINLDYSAGKYTLCENDVPTPECYTLNVNVAEGGYVNISPEADCYEEGTQITLTAEAYEGYQFSQWSDGNTDNPRLLTMTEDIYLTAVFTYTLIEEHSYTIRVKKDDLSDMDISNGLYLYWWKTDEAGQVATMTLDSDGWYTTTITTTATSINCLAVNVNVDNEGWIGQQTTDYTNITGDICLAIGTNDGFYNGNYNLYAVPCEDILRDYTITLQAPNCGGFEPAIIGDFNGWVEGVAMELQPDGSYKAMITSFAGQNFKFKATTDTDWSNEIQILSDGVWVNNPNITLGEQTNIYIDYSDGRYSSCEDVDEPSAQVKGDRIWPIILDDITASSNASKIVADFRVDDMYNFMYLWDMGAYVAGDVTGLNFHGNTEGYFALTVTAQNGWSGLGFCMGDESSSAAEQLRQRIIANPDNYYLHFAMKATTQGNHQFYTFNTAATSFAIGTATIEAGQVIGDFPRDGEWYEFDVPMADFADALATSTFPMGGNIFCALSGATVGSQLNLDALYFYEIEGEEEEEETEYSYTIRVKKDDVSDMDLSNGLYLWWWYNDQAGQLANMTLGDDGWYTTTITSTASSINCLAVNTDVVNNGWIGQQTIDHINITGDICLAIGAKDWLYNYNYNLYEIPCSPMEYTTEHDFEDTEANAQWRFVQNGQTNYWTIGSAAGSMDSGSNALYITSDGNNYTYNNNASSTSWAYLPVIVTAVDSITFYWKGEGESYCDDLQVYLFPKGYTPIAGSTYIPNSAIQLGEYLSGQTDWQYFSAMAGVEGEYNLCLRWYNDGSYGEMPIAVDNMAITTPLNTTEYPLTYVLDEDGTATVVKCATDYSGNVSIPTVVTYNGTTYTVTSISENAFKECGYLTSVTIPNSVTSIGRMAFAYCWSLESVTLSENISSIEDYTFYDCESLTSITIPNNVTYVGNFAFGSCYNLSAVTFGDNVTTIGSSAFAYCSSLSSVTIPASVSYIGYSTFVSCNSLNSIVVESGNTAYDSRNNCNAIIETASNTLITGCQSTIIPETVTTIGEQAFYDCEGLTTIAIPNSVTSIEYYAFAGCENLSSVDLGNGVTTISGSAFEYCYAMTSVTIPASVTEIGSWAFYYCPTIVMEGTTPPTISSSTFKSEAKIFVPCTALDTYLATSVWQDLNLQGSNYTVTLSATEGGYAQITASDCATNTVTIEAYPEERYVFTQWSDGNTDNPRILTLTEDIALTAEFTILTYPVTNLVVTTNCGKAYASWEGDAPYYELTMYSIDGTVVLYDLVPNHYKDGVSNSNPYEEGDYYCQVRPMYSNSEGDYAGEAVQAPFTISADNCVDIEIHDLSYTITDETTVNLTWNSEAYVYHVQLYDYQNNLIADEYINTNSYSYTLPEMGRYSFYVLGYNEDQTQFSSWQNISFDIVYSNWEYDLNFVYGEQGDNGPWNDAYQRPIHLYSGDYQTVMRIYPMPKYENSIIGTYFVENNTDNLYAGGMWGDGSYITYNGISTGAIQSGMVTIARNEENKFVVSFDLTDANGINYTNTCTIENMSGSNITDDNVTALSASQALTLTQNLPDHDLTTMPYMVNGVISRITSYDVNLYSRARFYISEDGSTTNEFYCYNTSWLNNTSFTTGDEIAEGDTVVIYGNLQNYQGTTPEIKGYVYQHFAKEEEEEDESCYTLTVDATEGGYVSISPLAECYEAGTQVVITATPNENYEFVTWSDGNTSAQRTIVMDKDYHLTATFRSTSIPTNNYTLTLTCDEGGTVGKNPNYEYYEENSTVTIFANANEGYKFVQWSDGNTENVRSITMTQDMVLHATFVEEQKEQFTLTLTAGEGGTVTKTPDQPSYAAGSVVTITAQANEGFEFVSWSDGNTSAQRTIVMDKDYNLTATFRSTNIPTNNYTLTLTCDEGGTVGKNPNYEYYEENTTVTIFANANEGYKFVQWSDGNTENIRSITMTQNTVLHATFVVEQKEQFSLTITADEGGTVTTIPNQDTYDAGTIVAVIANANDGYEFVRWSDGITDNVRSVTMTQDITLHATFVAKQKEQYTLSLTAGEGGSVTKTPDQPSYEDGTSVDIAAIANDGYEFVTWSDGNTSAQRTIIMDRDYSFTAIFQSTSVPADYYTLILTCDEGGTVRKSPDQEHYEVNTVVTIFAQANEGYDFVRWSDGNTDSIRTITMTQNIALHAIFVAEPKPQYVVSVTASEGGTVTKTPNQELYDEGTTVIIIAQANNGYEFAEWSDGNKNSVRSIIVTDHVVLQAIFVAKQTEQFTLTLTASEGGTAIKVPDQASYNAGSMVTIIAQANDGYEFVQWSDGNTENVRSITMTQDMVLHATFVEEQKEQFTLTLTAGEGGTVTKTPDQPSYAAGSVVTITAQANEGFEFVSWSDGDKNSVRHITMTQNVELNATFTRIASNYDITNLSVTSSNKRITAKWESIATRFEIVITDSNNEVEHSEKVDITDDSKVYKYTAKKLGTYTVTIKPLNASDQQIGIEDSKTVTLVMKYSLFISTENENAGTVNEEVNGDYVDGETVEIVATPKNGYRFKMWDDGDTNAKRTLVMNQDYYLTASFSRIPTYTLTISEGENGLASMAAGSYTYKENEEVTITPLPYDGYVFDHWVVNGIENTTETLTLVMTQDYSVYPVCVSKPIPTYTLTILPGEYGKANMEAGTYTYQEGEEVTLLPIADTDYLFDQWVVNDEVNTDSVLVLVMDKDYTVMPTFIPNQVGVENIYDGITILVEQWTITVEATQAQDIALYDLVGHLIEQQPHTRIASFTVPSAGLYLIRTSSGVKKVRVE